jgi:hypothetical protein
VVSPGEAAALSEDQVCSQDETAAPSEDQVSSQDEATALPEDHVSSQDIASALSEDHEDSFDEAASLPIDTTKQAEITTASPSVDTTSPVDDEITTKFQEVKDLTSTAGEPTPYPSADMPDTPPVFVRQSKTDGNGDLLAGNSEEKDVGNPPLAFAYGDIDFEAVAHYVRSIVNMSVAMFEYETNGLGSGGIARKEDDDES